MTPPYGAEQRPSSRHSTGRDAQRFEFLKDVTGFANANGGLLVIGVEEPADDLSVDAQLVGVAEGAEMAGRLDRRGADSIEPLRTPSSRWTAFSNSGSKRCRTNGPRATRC